MNTEPVDIVVRPISSWPGPETASRDRSRFRCGFAQTRDLLDRELVHLDAENVVIEGDFRSDDIRRTDGWPRAHAHPSSPRVVLFMNTPHGPMRYPCDRYDDWLDNIRAIALALQALRAVDRYGVTGRGEQYRGWSALPNPAKSNGFMSRESAAGFLVGFCPDTRTRFNQQQVLDDADALRKCYRLAAKAAHPDRGGSAEAFTRVVKARECIEAAASG